MAFPASKGVLSAKVTRASELALHMRSYVTTVRGTLAAGPTSASVVRSLEGDLQRYRTEFAAIAATAGIVEEARRQFNDPALDVAAEWNAMVSAIDGAIAWIRTNFPVDAGGYLLERSWTGDRTFTAAQTAGLRTQLDALVATVS